MQISERVAVLIHLTAIILMMIMVCVCIGLAYHGWALSKTPISPFRGGAAFTVLFTSSVLALVILVKAATSFANWFPGRV